ncbi:MAG: hypothetical protein ACRYGR_07550 [Janthinobacterium lividum]
MLYIFFHSSVRVSSGTKPLKASDKLAETGEEKLKRKVENKRDVIFFETIEKSF